MNWERATIEQLGALRDALVTYITARQRQHAQEQLGQVQADVKSLELELKETGAQLSAQGEMARRLRRALRLLPDGDGASSAGGNGRQGGDQGLSRAAVLEQLAISDSTLGGWLADYAQHLSPGVGDGVFTEDDVATLATVKSRLAEGFSADQVQEQLARSPEQETLLPDLGDLGDFEF